MMSKIMRKLFKERIVSVRFVAEWDIDALCHVEDGIVSGRLPHGKWIISRIDDRHFIAKWNKIGKRKNSMMILGNTAYTVHP